MHTSTSTSPSALHTRTVASTSDLATRLPDRTRALSLVIWTPVALTLLFIIGGILKFGRYQTLNSLTRRFGRNRLGVPRASLPQLEAAVNEALIWYPKSVRCLQRATATAWLLRLNGYDARLKIGVMPAPLASHAWVELEDGIVNESASYCRAFKVLDVL
jgi:hypothetical protein